MARLTIAQLSAELAALREHTARREAEWDTAQQRIAELEAQLTAPRIPQPEVRTATMSDFRRACQAARELAMRSGRSVLVTR